MPGLVDDVARVCRDLIGPTALATDADVVPRSHLDALAGTGLLGAAVDPSVPAADLRAAHERLAGTCLSTWFVLAQHQTPLRLVDAAPTSLRGPLLPLLASGTTVAGIAFSHLRRWPDRPVRAERTPGGWAFSGEAPWYTGWGINDVAVLAGATESGQVVFALVPAEAQPGMLPGEPADTVAVAAARTVRLRLDDLRVPDDGILAVTPMVQWQRADRTATSNASPAVFGAAQAAVDALAQQREPPGPEVAARFATRLQDLRSEAYALLDEVPAEEERAHRLRLRAWALRLCLDATTALVVAGGGRSLLRADAAQLRARWSLFLAVQAQTAELRAAVLEGLAPAAT